MAFRPSPSIPPGMEAVGWSTTVKQMQQEAARLATILLNGGPVPKDIQTRALALQSIMGGLSNNRQDLLADYLFAEHLAPKMAASHRVLDAGIEQHALKAAEDLRDWTTPAGYPFTPNLPALQAVSARTRQSMLHDWSRLTTATRTAVREEVARAMGSSINPREAARNLANRVGEAGGIGYKRGLLIARTEMADCYDAARMQTMDDLGDAVVGFRYRAQPDACATCQILHGLVFPKEEYPDRHHMCRCVIIPVLADDGVQPGEYATDANGKSLQRPRSAVEQQVPASWKPLPDDMRTMLAKRDNARWRPSWTVRKPGAAPPTASRPKPTPKPKPKAPATATKPPPITRGTLAPARDVRQRTVEIMDLERATGIDHGKVRDAALLQLAKYDGKPTVVPDIDKVKGKTITYRDSEQRDIFYRGMNGDPAEVERMWQQYTDGPMFVGHGITNNGTYMGSIHPARVFAEGADGNIRRMKIHPDAKVVDWADVPKPLELQRLYPQYGPDPKHQIMAWAVDNGVDIINPSGGELRYDELMGVCVINRSAVIVEGRPLTKAGRNAVR